MKAKPSRTIWVRFALLAACGSAQAYEPSTHSVLSRLAFDASTLAEPSRLNDLGFGSTALYREVNVDGAFVASQPAREVVAFGAFMEDAHHNDTCTLGWMRPFNHFFDPQHSGRALQVAGATFGHPSADWALEDKTGSGSSTSVTVTAGTHQQYSLTTTITDAGSPGFTCSGDGRVYYTDRAGKHFLNGNTGWIAIQ